MNESVGGSSKDKPTLWQVGPVGVRKKSPAGGDLGGRGGGGVGWCRGQPCRKHAVAGGGVTPQQEGSHSPEGRGNVWAKCEDQWEA